MTQVSVYYIGHFIKLTVHAVAITKFSLNAAITLNFQKSKVALNPLRKIFLNFAKSCILSCRLHFDNKKWGSPGSFFSISAKS